MLTSAGGASREFIQGLRDAGKITEQEKEVLLRDEELTSSPDAITILNLLVACGEKPA